jgi:Xaa-Pro aminopeptidase
MPLHTRPSARGFLITALVGVAAMSGCSAPDSGARESAWIAEAPEIATEEYIARRSELLPAIPDGVLVLHARPVEKTMEQWGFVQDPAFQYYSGLTEVPGAILALDGVSEEAHLFLPPAPMSFGMSVEGVVPAPGATTATAYGVSTARPWTEFRAWLRSRVYNEATAVYLDEPRRPEATGAPSGTPPLAGDRALWRAWISETVPSATLRSAKDLIVEQRAVKSMAEIAILERNAQTTAASLIAVARVLSPGVRQRETEAAMVTACLQTGGQGPSFWPWTMSGPNAHVGALGSAFFRYDQGDRVAEAGELVRVDIGCAGGGYGADVGRTLPVSGTFTDDQAEAWDLLITGYLAGLEAMQDGISVTAIRAASQAAVESRRADLRTPGGVAAADAIRDGGDGTWHIHSVGIEGGEVLPQTLKTGMVLAYEPGFSVGADAYYLEDMVLVTDSGHRVLSASLPYWAVDIEELMTR